MPGMQFGHCSISLETNIILVTPCFRRPDAFSMNLLRFLLLSALAASLLASGQAGILEPRDELDQAASLQRQQTAELSKRMH